MKEKRKHNDWLAEELQAWGQNIASLVLQIVETQQLVAQMDKAADLRLLYEQISNQRRLLLTELMRPALWLEHGDYVIYRGNSPAQGLAYQINEINSQRYWRATGQEAIDFGALVTPAAPPAPEEE